MDDLRKSAVELMTCAAYLDEIAGKVGSPGDPGDEVRTDLMCAVNDAERACSSALLALSEADVVALKRYPLPAGARTFTPAEAVALRDPLRKVLDSLALFPTLIGLVRADVAKMDPVCGIGSPEERDATIRRDLAMTASDIAEAAAAMLAGLSRQWW
jgi:hypothetical protein